jgi:hypothetical protein
VVFAPQQKAGTGYLQAVIMISTST